MHACHPAPFPLSVLSLTGPAGARVGADGRMHPRHSVLDRGGDRHGFLRLVGLSPGGVYCGGVLVWRNGDDSPGGPPTKRTRGRPRGFQVMLSP